MTPACPRCEAENPSLTGQEARCRRCGKRWTLGPSQPPQEPQASGNPEPEPEQP